MKNVIGTPARGESFFPREREVRKIIGKLNDGNNLNIAAPRRIGKTSILLHLLDVSEGGYIYVYVDTEDIYDESDFFKRILKEVLRTEEIRSSRRLKALIESGHKFLSRVKGIKLMGQGIDFVGDHEIIDYKEDIINLLSGIEVEGGKAIVILIDEFPQTIQNIIDLDPGDGKKAEKFLQSNREIRLNPEINKKVRFILTGSIGLNHTVAQIGATAFINDLNSVEIGALTEGDAKFFLEGLLSPKKIIVPPLVTIYLLKKIEWLIPFHIQLTVQEIISKSETERQIDVHFIDEAFDAIIEARNENHFNHYHSRLKKQFKAEEFSFVSDLLETVAKKGMVTRSEIFNLSVKYDLEQKWRHSLEILIYDGYLNNIGDKETFRFNSPILRMWWQRFICK